MSCIDILKESALYFDTNSVIFFNGPGGEQIKTGDLLGEMTNELIDFGANTYISEFVSGGPKNYAYKLTNIDVNDDDDSDERTVCKVKGIRLNYMNSKFINFESIKELLFRTNDPTNVEGLRIPIRNNIILQETNNVVYSMVRQYNYRINATKRRKLENNSFRTLPFGHS